MKRADNKEKAFALLDEASKRTRIFTLDPFNMEIFTLRSVAKDAYKFWAFTPDDALSPDLTISGLYLKNGHLREISRKAMDESFTADSLKDLRENRLLFIFYQADTKYYLIPSKDFIASLVKNMNGNGKIFRDVVSLHRDLFLAEAMMVYDQQLHFIGKGKGMAYRLLACVTDKYQPVDQSIMKEVFEEIEGAEFESAQISDTLTRFNIIFPDERVKNYCPGIQFVFSDTADSSTIVRNTIHMGGDSYIYLDDVKFNHKLIVDKDTLLQAVSELRSKEKFEIKKLTALKRRKTESPQEAFMIFKKLCVAVKFRSAIGSKIMDKIFADSKQYFESIDFDDMEHGFNVRQWTYEDIMVEFLGSLSRMNDITPSTAERVKMMTKNGVDFLYSYRKK